MIITVGFLVFVLVHQRAVRHSILSFFNPQSARFLRSGNLYTPPLLIGSRAGSKDCKLGFTSLRLQTRANTVKTNSKYDLLSRSYSAVKSRKHHASYVFVTLNFVTKELEDLEA